MSQVRSMTGFASVTGSLPKGGGSLPTDERGFNLTVKSVNHRHLDLALRLPSGLDALEPALRAAVKAAVHRGHVELTLTFEKNGIGTVQLDEALLAEYGRLFHQASVNLHVHQTLDLNAMLRLPGVLISGGGSIDPTQVEAALLLATSTVLTDFNTAREFEGAALSQELRASLGRLEELAAEAAQLRQGIGAAEFARLKSRLTDLLAGADVSQDRLLTEAALIAARSDIEEELVRLRTHIARFVELLEAGGEMGRPLDFLLQEMNREANTALSKSGSNASEAGLRLTAIGLEMKVELERAREQVQNLE